MARHPTASRTDEGFTLVEMLIAMAISIVILTAFIFAFIAFGVSATGTRTLGESQGATANALAVLEADLRSADPLMEVPAGFPLAAGQTAGPDAIALHEALDFFSPCQKGELNSDVPLDLDPVPATPPPNVIWSYTPATGTLSRWSYCSSEWTRDSVSLHGVVNPAGVIFHVIPPASAPNSQITSGATDLPVCATGVTIQIEVKVKQQTAPFDVRVTVPLPNQTAPAIRSQACQFDS